MPVEQGSTRDQEDSSLHPTVAALRALTRGDRAAAIEMAARGSSSTPLVSDALHRYLVGGSGTDVYQAPAAFEAFILGGGNVGLYGAVSAALAAGYRDGRTETLLDIGCGNGHAVAAALALAPDTVRTLTLVEPSAALLSAAVARLSQEQPQLRVMARNQTLEQFLADDDAGTFDDAQSTFALHTVPTERRSELLIELAQRTARLNIVEFDHSPPAVGTVEHLTFLATSYEQGLTEYDADDRELVAQGFLMGVLTGQLDLAAPRFTWEQPAHAWSTQAQEAGFEEVSCTPLHDYWSSPAFALTALGGAHRR